MDEYGRTDLHVASIKGIVKSQIEEVQVDAKEEGGQPLPCLQATNMWIKTA